MDAFYASVEQRDQPGLQGLPVAVGGRQGRGVVTTASYEARRYGVRSAMPMFQALQRCPQLICVPPRFAVYREVSEQIRAVFKEYTDLVEPLSLDEAFLDVTKNKKNIPYATDIAKEIMQRVEEETALTCSAGVSYCKFLAKIASDQNKPNGLTVIKPHQAEAFIEQLPIESFFGIGKVTAEKMRRMNIYTGADLKRFSKIELARRFGKVGRFYYHIVRGIDNRPVNPSHQRKSLGIERTLSQDLVNYEQVAEALEELLPAFVKRLQKADIYGRTLTLKLKRSDFQVLTRSISQPHYLRDAQEIRRLAFELLRENQDAFEKIRLIGLSLSNLKSDEQLKGGIQLKLDFD